MLSGVPFLRGLTAGREPINHQALLASLFPLSCFSSTSKNRRSLSADLESDTQSHHTLQVTQPSQISSSPQPQETSSPPPPSHPTFPICHSIPEKWEATQSFAHGYTAALLIIAKKQTPGNCSSASKRTATQCC